MQMLGIHVRIFCGMLLLALPMATHAAIPAYYTTDNFYTSEHDRPVSLYQYTDGGFYGYTATGKFYEQLPIQNLYDIKLHRFQIEGAYFYVSDRGVINASDDLVALSIYMSRA